MPTRTIFAWAACLVTALCGALPSLVLASELDEPGLVELADEPGIRMRAVPMPEHPRFRAELGFGLSSLLVDPDVKEGMGAGFYFAYFPHVRLGVELSAHLSRNRFSTQLGDVGTTLLESFLVGSVSMGPVVQLTRPGAPLSVTVDLGLGAYVVLPAVQPMIWTLGMSMGATVGWRLTRWFGVGLKLRYHLFNLVTLSGPQLRDRLGLSEVGVVDRFELPGFIAFYF